MSYAEELRHRLQPGSSDIVRAVIYARVSTDNEGQKDSCSNQVETAERFIKAHSNIKLVATFVDDGISGKNDFTRPQYNEMLQLLSTDGFDVILTKALSRLNRDELNSLLLNSMLMEHQATVLTLEDGQVHDFEDINSGLLHSIKYAMDAQYVKQQSINGKKSQELRCQRKELTAKDTSFGYDWDPKTKTISINDKQARIVRQIFEDYVFKSATPAIIKRYLEEEGIVVCNRTVLNMISDERYIGKFYINKRTSKLGTGKTRSKRIKLPKEQWVLCERPDLRIVDDDLFEMAQRIHRTRITVYEKPDRKTTQAYFQGIHKYAGKIFCPVCKTPYQFGYADRKQTLPVYKIKNHSTCSNPIRSIYESDIEEITKKALKNTISSQKDILTSIEEVLNVIVASSQDNKAEVESLKKKKKAKEKQMDSLIDSFIEENLSISTKNKLKERMNNTSEEIERLSELIKNKESSRLDKSYVDKRMRIIKDALSDLKNFNSIDRERILNYIDHIEMPPTGDVDIILKSGHIIEVEPVGDRRVSKLSIQDVSDTRLDNNSNRVFLTSFSFEKSIHSRETPYMSQTIKVNCYLLSRGDG